MLLDMQTNSKRAGTSNTYYSCCQYEQCDMRYILMSNGEWSDGVNFDWTFPYHQTRDPPRHLHLPSAWI